MSESPTQEPWIRALVAAGKRQWIVVLALTAGAGAIGLAAHQVRAPSFAADGVVRVGTIAPLATVVDAPTVAGQMSAAGFVQRIRQQANVQGGTIAAEAIFKTDLVRVRTTSTAADEAERLLDAATAAIVTELNTLSDSIVARAQAELVSRCSSVVVEPILARPTARIEPLAAAAPAGPRRGFVVASALAFGFALGLLAAWLREAWGA